MDPATISLIINGLFATIDAYNRLEAANSGLSDDQRAARKQARKDLVAMANTLGTQAQTQLDADGG